MVKLEQCDIGIVTEIITDRMCWHPYIVKYWMVDYLIKKKLLTSKKKT